MRITSFHKALMGTAAVTGLVGGTTAMLLMRGDRKDADEAAYRARAMPVDEMVKRIFADYDNHTHGSAIRDDRDDGYGPDGVITIGAENYANYDASTYREFLPPADDYGQVVSASRFLIAADAAGDGDGHVTKPELRAAILEFAGDDELLSATERRMLLVDQGLSEVVDEADQKPRTSYEQHGSGVEGLRLAYEVAHAAIYALDPDSKQVLDGSRAARISAVEPMIPWVQTGTRLATGEIRSPLPTLTSIDEAGNRDGLVSEVELATWLADENRSAARSYGHISWSDEQVLERLHSQVLGRIDADTLQGHAYLAQNVRTADTERFYGGDLAGYLDSIEGVRAARGNVEWEPDPVP